MNQNILQMIHSATLAANEHNSQPWKFSVKPTAIRIYPDAGRHTGVVDPDDRELWISLGCALENLVIAAHALGYETTVTYPTPLADYINVQYKKIGEPHPDPLYDAIPERQSTRSPYSGKPVLNADLERIQSIPLEPGISTHIFTSLNEMDALLDFVEAGDHSLYDNGAFKSELAEWIRFNKTEAFETLDGLYSPCVGSPEVPRWLGKVFMTTVNGGQQSQTDAKYVRSSSGVIIIASEEDNKNAWINTGRVYERLALTMTALNIRCAFLNQPVEAKDVREKLQAYLQIDNAQPQLLLRFGYAKPMPRSLRRPVEEVLV